VRGRAIGHHTDPAGKGEKGERAPYSLRHIARRYRADGYVAIAIRLPAHGTVPAALTDVEWEDWSEATRLAVREAGRRIGPSRPLLAGSARGLPWRRARTSSREHLIAAASTWRSSLLVEAYAAALPGARPGLVLFVQTFGDLANFNPHVQVLATDGAFRADGTFVALPAIPQGLLADGFRRAVLGFLVGKGVLSEELRTKLLGWRHSGFSVHNQFDLCPLCAWTTVAASISKLR